MNKVDSPKERGKYKTLFINILIFALGSFGSKLIIFFLVPLYTNVLTTEQYGVADLVTTFAEILVPICGLVIHDAVLRYGLSKGVDKGSVIKNALLVWLIGTLVSLAFVPLISLYKPVSDWAFYIFGVTSAMILNNILLNYAKAKDQNKTYSLCSIIQTLVLATLNLLFLLVFKLEVQGYILANMLSIVVADVILFILTKTFKDIRTSKFDKKLFKSMVKYSLPLIANNLSWWILNYSDRVMVERYMGSSSLGIYAAASKIPALLSIVTTIFSQAWTVSSIREYDEDKDQSFFTNVFKYFSIIMFFGTTLIILILQPFMRFYVGQDFYEAWKYVPFLLFGAIFFAFGSFYGAIYGALKKNIAVTVTTLIAAAINIVINLLLIPRIGIMAASISTAVSYFAIGIMRMVHSRKYFKFKINYVTLSLNSAVVLALVILVSYDINIYICAASAIVLLLLINIKDIKGIFTFIKTYIIKKKSN